jgi:hypothetical protein
MKKALLVLIGFLATTVGLQAQSVLQKVLIEEHTGAWCGWCPDGAVLLHDILTNEPNAIGVAVHQGDAMAIPLSSSIRSFYGPAFPQATINRSGDPLSRGAWSGAVATALQRSPVVSVSFDSVSINGATRQLTARIKASFLRDTVGQLRFNLYLTESNLVGNGTGWNQVNYLNTTAGHTYYQAGDPIVGFSHQHVLRDALGSAWGTVNIIPSPVTAGSEYTHTYTYTIPATWDISNMHIVAMVNLHGGQLTYQRPTLNADEMPLAMAVGIEDGVTGNSALLNVYPNPATDRVHVAFTVAEMGNVRLEVYNTVGQRVATLANGFTNSGTHSLNWLGLDEQGRPAPRGVYFVRLSTEAGESRVTKLILQ